MSRIEREIEFKNVDLAPFRVLIQELQHLLRCQPAGFGDAGGLKAGIGNRNVWIQSGSRGRHGINRNRSISRQPILLTVRSGAFGDSVEQLLALRAAL